jgi:hypothetical protein
MMNKMSSLVSMESFVVNSNKLLDFLGFCFLGLLVFYQEPPKSIFLFEVRFVFVALLRMRFQTRKKRKTLTPMLLRYGGTVTVWMAVAGSWRCRQGRLCAFRCSCGGSKSWEFVVVAFRSEAVRVFACAW